MEIAEGLLVLANAEAGDESAPDDIVVGSAHEVQSLAGKLKVEQVMLLPFAHLFAEPAPPAEALAILDRVAESLRAAGLQVQRPPFGWFHRWDLKAKGHPLSRVARQIRPPLKQESAPGG
jgi:threonyl-tRNA synthetase